MESPTDLTTQILIQIRDGIAATNERLDATNERLDATNARLDSTAERLEASIDRLDRRMTQVEVRLATELVAVAHGVDLVRELLRTRLDDHERVEDHEHRIRALERGRREQ